MEEAVFVMKKHELEKLLTIMKAKTQIERIEYANMKAHQDYILKEAQQLRENASESRAVTADIPSAAFIKNQERFLNKSLDHANKKEVIASTLDPAVLSRRQKLENALQKELVIESLSLKAREEARKEHLATEEKQREFVHNLRIQVA